MILLSFGTRPEWIKIKPLLDQMEGKIPYRLLFTGQHTDLLSKVGEGKDLMCCVAQLVELCGQLISCACEP